MFDDSELTRILKQSVAMALLHKAQRVSEELPPTPKSAEFEVSEPIRPTLIPPETEESDVILPTPTLLPTTPTRTPDADECESCDIQEGAAGVAGTGRIETQQLCKMSQHCIELSSCLFATKSSRTPSSL